MIQKILAAIAVPASVLCVSLSSLGQTVNLTIIEDSAAEAPAEEKRFKISGSADAYYRYDFERQLSNNKTAFTNSQNAFALGMASIKMEHEGARAGAVIDLGFGPRAQEFSYNESGALAAVKQLYAFYKFSDALKVTAGTWATHVGYELLDPQLNRNYSMGYMFSYGPFSHTGVKVDYTRGAHSMMAGISNPTDYRMPPSSLINSKFLLAQYAYAPGNKTKIYLNYVGGKNVDSGRVHQYDLVATYAASSKFNLALNASVNHTAGWQGSSKNFAKPRDWWGLAGYFNYDPLAWLGLTWRAEYFNDHDYVKGFGGFVLANTLSANFKAGGFTFVPELRLDDGKNKIYVNHSGEPRKSELSALVACVYAF